MKLLIIVIFSGIVASLAAGLFFLVNDQGQSRRLVNALTLRVALSVLLFVLLIGVWLAGLLRSGA